MPTSVSRSTRLPLLHLVRLALRMLARDARAGELRVLLAAR